jgi:hypothetical protein
MNDSNNGHFLRKWEIMKRFQQEIIFSVVNTPLHGGDPEEIVEARLDRKCPFCYYPKVRETSRTLSVEKENVAKIANSQNSFAPFLKVSDEELLHHCRRFHGDYHLFEATTLKDGTVRRQAALFLHNGLGIRFF